MLNKKKLQQMMSKIRWKKWALQLLLLSTVGAVMVIMPLPIALCGVAYGLFLFSKYMIQQYRSLGIIRQTSEASFSTLPIEIRACLEQAVQSLGIKMPYIHLTNSDAVASVSSNQPFDRRFTLNLSSLKVISVEGKTKDIEDLKAIILHELGHIKHQPFQVGFYYFLNRIATSIDGLFLPLLLVMPWVTATRILIGRVMMAIFSLVQAKLNRYDEVQADLSAMDQQEMPEPLIRAVLNDWLKSFERYVDYPFNKSGDKTVFYSREWIADKKERIDKGTLEDIVACKEACSAKANEVDAFNQKNESYLQRFYGLWNQRLSTHPTNTERCELALNVSLPRLT